MKYKNKCVYKNVCNGTTGRCKNCELKFAPYDLNIAAQLKKEKERSKYKYEDDRQALALEVLIQKKVSK